MDSILGTKKCGQKTVDSILGKKNWGQNSTLNSWYKYCGQE